MSRKPLTPSGSIYNRSPWLVRVRSQPALDRQFRYGNKPGAQAYLEQMIDQGLIGTASKSSSMPAASLATGFSFITTGAYFDEPLVSPNRPAPNSPFFVAPWPDYR